MAAEGTEGETDPQAKGDAQRPRKRKRGGSEAPSAESRLPLDEPEAKPVLERRSVLAALEAGLAEALPGVEVLDRDLAFDLDGRAGSADLVAVDPLGRLVLVLIAGEEPERTVLAALDLAVYAREQVTLLVRHIASRRVDPGLDARVVVVDPAADEALAKRLGVLAASGLEVFQIRTLKSAAGERSYLIAAGSEARAPRSGERGVREFLDALPLALREVGRELTDRMARLDEELFATADRSTLVWRFHGQVLARLECDGARLTASVAPGHRPEPILGPDDVDGLLEGALARVLEAADGDEPLPERPLEAPEPILTPEEIEAFQG